MDASVAGSATARNQSLDQLSSPDNPAGPVSSNSSSNNKTSHHHGHDRQRDDGEEKEDDAEERHRHRHHHHHRPRRLFIDTSDLDRDKSKSRHRHKHSKSRRDIRLPRTMNQIATSSGARSLFPTRSSAGKDKDRDADDGLLRPTVTRSTTRSRLGSGSTSGPETGSRKGSLIDDSALGLVKRREIRTMEDLERERERRQLGEASLRSALSSIGTLATDITRRLDYTYYNLLEKLSALHVTIDSFQELSDSTALLCSDFQRETATLDQEARKQLEDFKGFLPQIQKIDALERRMRAGRERVEALGDRLEAVKGEIDGWERREREWQARISRRLRILWTVMGTAMVILVLAIVIQNWPSETPSPPSNATTSIAVSTNQSLEAGMHTSDHDELSLGKGIEGARVDWSPPPLELANLYGSRESTCSASTATTKETENAWSKHTDALRKFDEL